MTRYVLVHFDGRSELLPDKTGALAVWIVRTDGSSERAYKRCAYATQKAEDNADAGTMVYVERPMEHVDLLAMQRI